MRWAHSHYGPPDCFLTLTLTLTLAALSVTSSISCMYGLLSVYFYRKRSKELELKIEEVEASLSCAVQKSAAEREGRVRAQQDLRKALAAPPSSEDLHNSSFYPLRPIGVVRSCFSTRNGTPRQPLLVPLARAHLLFHSPLVPPASLQGLADYSHCWIIYVFHLNTDLHKLWNHPSRSKFKAKVRVPRLKGDRKGVFATRSPHRPCPIGLTVAKVEEVQGNVVSLSGVDLVNGTPILDIKPYLPYCDSIQGATVPEWVMEENGLAVASVTFAQGFSLSLANCWEMIGKKSLYASADEVACLIKQVLSWDIRSVSQRNQPHNPRPKEENGEVDTDKGEEGHETGMAQLAPEDVIYHLILEQFDVSYRVDNSGNVNVESVKVASTPEPERREQKTVDTNNLILE